MPVFTLLFILWLAVTTILASRCICFVKDTKKSPLEFRKPITKSDQKKHWISCLSDTESTVSSKNYKVAVEVRKKVKGKTNHIEDSNATSVSISKLHSAEQSPIPTRVYNKTWKTVKKQSHNDDDDESYSVEKIQKNKEESEYSISDYCDKHKKEFFPENNQECQDCKLDIKDSHKKDHFSESSPPNVISCTIPTGPSFSSMTESLHDQYKPKKKKLFSRDSYWSKNKEKHSDTEDSAIVTLSKNDNASAKRPKKQEFSDFTDNSKQSDILYDIGKGKPGIHIRKPFTEDSTSDDFAFSGVDAGISNVMSDLNKTIAEIGDIMENTEEKKQDEESETQEDNSRQENVSESDTNTESDSDTDNEVRLKKNKVSRVKSIRKSNDDTTESIQNHTQHTINNLNSFEKKLLEQIAKANNSERKVLRSKLTPKLRQLLYN